MAATKGNGSTFGRKPRNSVWFVAWTWAARAATAEISRRFLSPTKKTSFVQSPTGAVVGGGTGPDLIIGKATTRGLHQSVLSTKRLSPPVKWSYRKLILWSALVFLSIGWNLFYINTIAGNSSAVSSLPLIPFSRLSAVTFLLLLVLFWRHNQSTYKRRYSQWERSFLCQRCGSLMEQE